MKPNLRRLNRRLSDLEAKAAAEREPKLPPGHASYRFSMFLYTAMHPDYWGELPAEDRRALWPWWHMIEFHFQFYTVAMFDITRVDEVKKAIHDAAHEWMDDPDEVTVKWNPINSATVHWVKAVYREVVRSAKGPGLDGAQPIDEFFPDSQRPWSRSFNPDPATWPPGLLERVRGSGSICPDPVPEFDWTKIPRSWNPGGEEHPFPRHPDGRPIRGHFRRSAEDDTCAA